MATQAREFIHDAKNPLSRELESQLRSIGENSDVQVFWEELTQFGIKLRNEGHDEKGNRLLFWIQAQTPITDILEKAKKEVTQPGWDGVLRDTVFSIGIHDLADVAIFHASNRIGNMAKIGLLRAFRNRSLTSFPWVLIARSAGVWTEGSMIWGMKTFYENARRGFQGDVDAYTLLKSAAATQFMMRGIRVFGVVAYETAPRAARALRLIRPNGVLSPAGNFLVKGATHGASMAGMLTVLNLTRDFGLIPHSPEGPRHELAHDVFSYFKYAIASNGFSRILGRRYHEGAQREFREILRLESEAKSETYLKKIGFKISVRQPNGQALFDPKSNIIQRIRPHLNLVEKSSEMIQWVHRIFTQMSHFQVQRPGFDGTKVFRLLEKKGISAAETYCARFGLQFRTGEKGGFEIEEMAPPSP